MRVVARLAIPPAPGDLIEIMPFRGSAVWQLNHFVDTGPFQFYGHAIQSIVAENTFERVDVIAMDGQWRGWAPAADRGEPALGGVANNGMQPNVHISVLDNVMAEGNAIFPFNKSGGGGPYPTRAGNYVVQVSACETGGKPCPTSHNLFIAIRGNTLASNAGIQVGQGSRDVLIEGNAISEWPADAPPIDVDPRAPFALVVNNSV